MSDSRLFLALSIPREIREELYRVREPLREAWRGIRWVPNENYHITLVFFGSRNAAFADEIRDGVSRALAGREAFTIEFSGPACFGDPRRPRIIYEGIGRGREELTELHSRLEPWREEAAGRERRSYRPHLTLGRPGRGEVRGPDSGRGFGVGWEGLSAFPARKVVLFRSESGPRYNPLEIWNLQYEVST